MEKMCRTARWLDTAFKWMFALLAVCFGIVFFCGAMVLFFENAGSAATSFGNLTFRYNINGHAAEIPLTSNRWAIFAIASVSMILVLILAYCGTRVIRGMLKPMKEGRPFDAAVSRSFRRLGVFAIIYGVLAHGIFAVVQALMLHAIRVDGMMEHVSVNFEFDLTFLLVAGLLFLFSYIFRYGEELQRQADETL